MKYNNYIASPFFNDDDLKRIKEVEYTLDEVKSTYYSPKDSGIILNKNLSADMKKIQGRRILDSNVDAMKDCNKMICLLHRKDSGTLFELGWWVAQYIDPVSSYLSSKEKQLKGLNSSLLILDPIEELLNDYHNFLKLVELKDEVAHFSVQILTNYDDLVIDCNKIYVLNVDNKPGISYILRGFLYYHDIPFYTYSTNNQDASIITSAAGLGNFNNVNLSDIENTLTYDYHLRNLGMMNDLKVNKDVE